MRCSSAQGGGHQSRDDGSVSLQRRLWPWWPCAAADSRRFRKAAECRFHRNASLQLQDTRPAAVPAAIPQWQNGSLPRQWESACNLLDVATYGFGWETVRTV